MTHRVERGQTLWRIAATYGVPLDELARVNGIEDPAQLQAGRRLFVPGADRVLELPPLRGISGARSLATVLAWPLRGEVLSSFGAPRSGHRHTGLDIRGRRGQPVRAADDGRVTHSGALRGYGATVIVDHGRGLRTLYAHNSELLVRVGQRVERGQPIARVGASGNATADHCHFEVRRDDRPVDPLAYLSEVAR